MERTRQYKIKYKCRRCLRDTAQYTWRCRATSRRAAARKFYDTDVMGWKIVSITEIV